MVALQETAEVLRVFSEPTRVRLLAVLAHEELTVAELVGVTRLGQSRVSTHLGKLREAGVVRDRRVGSASFYALNDGMGDGARRVWEALRDTVQDSVLERDLERAREIVAGRKAGMSWADTVAGQMERHYSPGRTWEATARGFLGLCRLGDVLDVASGDGALAELVAPRAKSVTCLDSSERVIAAARRRLSRVSNVQFETGDMNELPFEDASFDAVLLMNCLTHTQQPKRAIAQAARVLRRGGLLTGVTLAAHTHNKRVEAYGHVNAGFPPKQLRKLIRRAGLTVDFCDATSRESNAPHFEVITFHASR